MHMSELCPNVARIAVRTIQIVRLDILLLGDLVADLVVIEVRNVSNLMVNLAALARDSILVPRIDLVRVLASVGQTHVVVLRVGTEASSVVILQRVRRRKLVVLHCFQIYK